MTDFLPPKLWYFSNFHKTAQTKQSPNGRKIAKSGHPGLEEWQTLKRLRLLFTVACSQCDPIGLGSYVHEYYRSSPYFWATLFNGYIYASI
jgi:hypothetical protein